MPGRTSPHAPAHHRRRVPPYHRHRSRQCRLPPRSAPGHSLYLRCWPRTRRAPAPVGIANCEPLRDMGPASFRPVAPHDAAVALEIGTGDFGLTAGHRRITISFMAGSTLKPTGLHKSDMRPRAVEYRRLERSVQASPTTGEGSRSRLCRLGVASHAAEHHGTDWFLIPTIVPTDECCPLININD
jgi:hypothetical protein